MAGPVLGSVSVFVVALDVQVVSPRWEIKFKDFIPESPIFPIRRILDIVGVQKFPTNDIRRL